MTNAQALKNQTYAQLGGFLSSQSAQAVQLLQLNGVNIDQSASPSQIQIAFLTAIKNSASFRSQAANAISQWLTSRPAATVNNFVDNSSKVYLNDIESGDSISIDPNSFQMPVAGAGNTDNAPNPVTSDLTDDTTPVAQPFNIGSLTPQGQPASPAPVVVPGTASGLFNAGAVAGDVAGGPGSPAPGSPPAAGASSSPNLITSGLNLIGQEIASQTAKSNAQSALGLAQANLAAQALKNQAPTTNWSNIIIISIAILAIGGIGYAIFHKKKAPVAAAA